MTAPANLGININIPITITKAFNKVEIDKMYRKMESEADRIAFTDATELLYQKRSELMNSAIGEKGRKPGSIATALTQLNKEVLEYKNKMKEYHLNNMIKLLELRAQVKLTEQ